MADRGVPARAQAWAGTMAGYPDAGREGTVQAHGDSRARLGAGPLLNREQREERERALLRPGS
ncbi:MAG: hypothetical protein ACLGIF_00150, partial [Actinomycetes bacterium]